MPDDSGRGSDPAARSVATPVPTGPVDLTSRSALAAYAFLAVFILVALGHPVPYNNEHHYLAAAYRLFHPEFAVSDAGFGEPLYAHLIVQTAAGALMTVLPLEVVGWILRLTSWTAVTFSIVLIASLIGARPWVTAVTMVIWLTNHQTILGEEWVMGGAEAKTFAYPLLFLAVHQLLTGHAYRAAMLVGLGVSLHPLVGVQLGGAICFGSLFVRPRTWRVPVFAGLVVLFSLPGVVPMVYGQTQGAPLTASDWEFIMRYGMPVHFDPSSFPRRSYLILLVMAAFDLMVCWRFREEEAFRFWGATLVALALVLGGGLLAWNLEAYSLLQVMPFRVLPVLALMAVGEPVAGLIDMRFGQNEEYRYPTGAYDWIARETPNDALVLSPPGIPNSISRSERGQVAYYRWMRTRDLADWRARLEAVLGPSENAQSEVDWLAKYDDLTPADLARIRRQYGATHFVTTRGYDLPLLFEEGGWRVYSLEGLPGSTSALGA